MSEAPGAAPIADLSYRNYDGPLLAHRFRWWIIARMMVRLTVKRRGFWVITVLAALPYLFPGFQLYLRSRMPDQFLAFLGDRPFTSFFYDAFAQQQLWIFLLALLAGAGSIAGDNATNALQIYLSRPLTRLDYLAGKWCGIFGILAVVALAPAAALYLFCLGSFQDQGFLRDFPHLWLQALGICLLPAALHASLLLGFSAWFKRPMMAGGIYAGVYFGLQAVFTIVGAIMWRTGNREHMSTVIHLSLPGIVRGIGQHVFGVLPTFFGMPTRMRGGIGPTKPDLLPLVALAVALVILALIAARARVRAVEVVRG